jgi:hypothetical protein
MYWLLEQARFLRKGICPYMPDLVPRVSATEISEAAFATIYGSHQRPVIITNSTADWQTNRWTKSYLSLKLRDRRVCVNRSVNGIFDYNISSGSYCVSSMELPVSSALDAIFSKDNHDYYYIQQESITESFPELLADIRRPQLLSSSKTISASNLWLGSRGCKSPLHYDTFENFLTQVKGLKRVILFPPSESPNLYPALDSRLPHCSRVNVFAPDSSEFPLYAAAEQSRLETLLAIGETLYIPALWWHAVESLEMSISVNFWWR